MKKNILLSIMCCLMLAPAYGQQMCEKCEEDLGPHTVNACDEPVSVSFTTERFAISDGDDAVRLCWDVYLPDEGVFPPRWPVVVIIHGGGFEQNHRKVGNLICIAHDLVESGFAAVSISYRLDKFDFNTFPCGQVHPAFSPQYAPTDQISDVKKGIIAASRGEIVGRTSVLNGKVTGKVGAIGGSAGGAPSRPMADERAQPLRR